MRPGSRPRIEPRIEEEFDRDDVNRCHDSPQADDGEPSGAELYTEHSQAVGHGQDDDAVSEPSDHCRDANRKVPRHSRQFPALLALLATLTVAVLAFGTVFGLQWTQGRNENALRNEALAVAREQAVNLLTINPKDIDRQLQAVLDGSTGTFQRQFRGIRTTFEQVVRQGGVSSSGSVDEAGISNFDKDSAEVLLALRATVKNSETPEGSSRLYRVRVDLVRKGDQWLVSAMQFVS